MVKAIKRRPYGRKKHGVGGRVLGWIVKAILFFILVSVLWVLLYRFVNPPVTFTQMGDMLGGRSVAKDWMPLARIDAT